MKEWLLRTSANIKIALLVCCPWHSEEGWAVSSSGAMKQRHENAWLPHCHCRGHGIPNQDRARPAAMEKQISHKCLAKAIHQIRDRAIGTD